MACRELTIAYTTTEVDGGARIVLRGETGSILARDTITIAETNAGAQVRYHARIDLKGLRKVADPVMAVALRRVGKRATEGLSAQLASSW